VGGKVSMGVKHSLVFYRVACQVLQLDHNGLAVSDVCEADGKIYRVL